MQLNKFYHKNKFLFKIINIKIFLILITKLFFLRIILYKYKIKWVIYKAIKSEIRMSNSYANKYSFVEVVL